MRQSDGLWKSEIFPSIFFSSDEGEWEDDGTQSHPQPSVRARQPVRHVSNFMRHSNVTSHVRLYWGINEIYADLDEEINPNCNSWAFILLCDLNRPRQTLVGSRYTPPSPPHTQTHTAGQSFFTQPNGSLTGLGEGLPPWKTDWQDWHFHIVQLIMGICLDAPVWGPSRVHGCCHRDGGEPLVAWGADRVILLRGGQTWPPVTLLFWFGWETASTQPGDKQRIPGPADP